MYGPASGSESFHDIEKERKRLKKERKELDHRGRKEKKKSSRHKSRCRSALSS